MNTPQEFITNYELGLAAQSWSAIAPLIHERCVVTFNEGTHVCEHLGPPARTG